MTRPRIYTDTSVIGGLFDKAFQDASRRLFDRFLAGEAIAVVSDLTILELQNAPDAVRRALERVPSQSLETILITREAEELAAAYIQAGVIGPSSREDARHIATATVYRVDVLVSWNFKHIVNLNRIHGYNSVNLRQGYPLLEIRAPLEVIDYGRNGEQSAD